MRRRRSKKEKKMAKSKELAEQIKEFEAKGNKIQKLGKSWKAHQRLLFSSGHFEPKKSQRGAPTAKNSDIWKDEE